MVIEEIAYIEPVYLFNALKGLPYPFLIGGDGLDGTRAYSYVGADPFSTIIDTGQTLFIDGKESAQETDIFEAVSHILERHRCDKGPFPFSSGAVGYFSYALKDKLFKGQSKTRLDNATPAMPASIVGFYDPIIVCDHTEKKSFIVGRATQGSKERLAILRSLIDNIEAGEESAVPGALRAPHSNLSRAQYISKVERAKEYISEGDIYQINISQNFEIPWEGDPFSIFRALLKSSPAIFSFYMDCKDFQIISNSPERLLKIDGTSAITEPIKGTRRRGDTPENDSALLTELKESKKERAEHVMIVDLERNDLGKISEPGSVTVDSFEDILTLPGLHHMVSTISGTIKKGLDAPTCLKSIFPGGSITGAPKARAIEIIDELEDTPRGLYTGALGWIDLSGDTDMSIAIRTAIYYEKTLYISVGSGIVADSSPADEYDETILKAASFFNLIMEGHSG